MDRFSYSAHRSSLDFRQRMTPLQTGFGVFGAATAAPLMMITGKGIYALRWS